MTISYALWQKIEGDTDKHSNWELINYEFPFPEVSVERERLDEEFRYQMKKNPLIALSCENQSI